MKPIRHLSLFTIGILFTGLVSCKKISTGLSSADNPDVVTTTELSSDQAISDNLNEDVSNAFMEAAANKNLLGSIQGSQPVVTSNMLVGAGVTVTPAVGFPKSIVINFGNGILNTTGILREGKILVTLTDSVRKAGSKATITFENFSANGYKKEGTITWTNTSIPSTRSWQFKVENGKVTAPDGRYWLHNGVREMVQIGGTMTPNILTDDVYLITGNQTVTNAAGKTRDCYITQGLQKNTSCDNIGTGKLSVQGAGHTAVIDFGNGDCDKFATLSVDGQSPQTILLR
ncbi:MAG: hypothetical protein JST86_06895 [Bacteroidetes bacterium]|nr:hypothetical protein [Bacteroidota bacterium]